MTVVSVEGVSKSYDGRSKAVEQVSFQVRERELVVLLGESGCGKTTLLKMINRLEEPSSGTIRFQGRPVLEMDPILLRRSIGYVFQGIGLFPHMTIAQNVGITPTLLGWEPERISSRVVQLLRLVHLDPDEYAGRVPAELSGGQQQRVGFARALAAEPSLLLLDEPFGALDPITRDRLQNEFLQIQRDLGISAVLVTHDIAEALLLADRIMVMRDGRILQEGRPDEILGTPANDYIRDLVTNPARQWERMSALLDRRSPGRGGVD